MNVAVHFLKFFALAALGYASVFLIVTGALQFGIIDALPADQHLYNFTTGYFGGGLFACIFGTLLGTLSFFTQGRTGRFFLLLPFAVPALYSLAILTYFSLLPA